MRAEKGNNNGGKKNETNNQWMKRAKWKTVHFGMYCLIHHTLHSHAKWTIGSCYRWWTVNDRSYTALTRTQGAHRKSEFNFCSKNFRSHTSFSTLFRTLGSFGTYKKKLEKGECWMHATDPIIFKLNIALHRIDKQTCMGSGHSYLAVCNTFYNSISNPIVQLKLSISLVYLYAYRW